MGKRVFLVWVLLAVTAGCGLIREEPVTKDELVGSWSSSQQGGEITFTADGRFSAKEFLDKAPEGDRRLAGAGSWAVERGSQISLRFDPGAVAGGGYATSLYATRDDGAVEVYGWLGDPDTGRRYLFRRG